MATVTLTTEDTYSFDVDSFVEEFHTEFLSWLGEDDFYEPTEEDKVEFVRDEIHELGGDDIRYMSHIFRQTYDDFSMDVRV